MKKIAIQGTLGSYHDIAAHKYFEGEEIELICCANFEDVFGAIKKDSQTIGMLAIVSHFCLTRRPKPLPSAPITSTRGPVIFTV